MTIIIEIVRKILEESKERAITMESHHQHFTSMNSPMSKKISGSEQKSVTSFGSVKEIIILILV